MKITSGGHHASHVVCQTCGATLQKNQIHDHHHNHRYNTGHRR